jgi:hypothetical protein
MNILRGNKLLLVGGMKLEIGLKHHEHHYISNYLGMVQVFQYHLSYHTVVVHYEPNFNSSFPFVILRSAITVNLMVVY